MKTNKKAISIALSILCCALLASCGQGGSDKLVEIPVKNYFDQQEIIVKIQKKTMMFGDKFSEGGFISSDDFSTVKNDFIKNNPDFKFKKSGDHCLLLTTGESGAMRHYLLTLYSDINYGVFSPAIYTEHIIENNDIGMAGERLYYPIHLLHYSRQGQRMDFLGTGVNLVKANEFYQIKGSAQEFKQFYADTGCFTIEDTEDGFIVSIPEESPDKERVFKEKYRFQFQENDGVTKAMYSKVAE